MIEAISLRPDTVEDLDGLVSFLSKRTTKGIQRGERYKNDIHHFTIARLATDTVLEGMISGPKTHDIRFRLTKGAKRSWTIKVLKSSGSLVADLKFIRDEVMNLQAAALNRKSDFTPNTSHWSGPYMQARPAGSVGVSRFREVVDSGIVSQEFADLALEWGFTMTKY